MLVRVTSWIVLVYMDKGTIREIRNPDGVLLELSASQRQANKAYRTFFGIMIAAPISKGEIRSESSVLSSDIEARLRRFIEGSQFCTQGGIITDLDGTAVHEDRGRIFIPEPVELGLKQIYDSGRPLILNSLRFPLSVIRTFGKDWYTISNAPIPCITLNGSLLGYVTKAPDDQLIFQELSAAPLSKLEIDEALARVQLLLDANLKDILVFYYPRDWRIGEVIWTPLPEQVIPVKEKYTSASSVTAVEFSKLRDQMHMEDICMIFLLLNIPEDQLMAYQHTQRSHFITHRGVDKLFGTQAMAEHLKIVLSDSIGAGDTPMDVFLKAVGLAIIVGGFDLSFTGLAETLRFKDSFELGNVLFRIAALAAEKR
jgi:hydroxymethylpyrimidine pyrophosphatase-like HAD family hydrolase